MPRRPLGQLEAEVLAALAGLGGSARTAELVERLDGEPAYTTVNTILHRLHEKRLVTRTRAGRHYRYRLAIDESELVAGRMREHLRLASDPGTVLSRFVSTLSDEEARQLRAFLEGAAIEEGAVTEGRGERG
ncbi:MULTISPECIES: BlaI/MecI/CopY family transcriptional regulator [Actinomadura]|uniref:BlaI/MecI/CopY family transcriptional regulator n=1 Tax=Actinomadura TaxID=1988 RepID=UPI001BE4C131|nr:MULTISPECIES: BlaI/MecI/CopY family transcriptional regulator [Actinomadura]MBT2207920.1 BlaI/MecI/CopY family transcriptional regulator [Actinomadura sp. NEAU-AAG7]